MAEQDTTLLVVEDDKFLRDLLVRKLKQEGYAVETAVDGNEAVDKVGRVDPDLVLLDLILPGIDGFEVLRRLNEGTAAANLPPIVILSNLGQKDDVQRGLDLGAQDYMIKAHFTPSEVIEKIQGVLSGGSSQ